VAGNVILLSNEVYFDFSNALINIEKIEEYQGILVKAMKDLADLESGEIVNTDEERMVGHYWLRDPELAPTGEIEKNIKKEVVKVNEFCKENRHFNGMIYLGMGGSALGPQLIGRVFKDESSKDFRVIDNTDPETFWQLTRELGDSLKDYLIVSVSKSGGTRETDNLLNEFKAYFRGKKWDFSSNAICITTPGSKLEEKAVSEKWLKVFYIWDWVGGRTSIASAVGLLPLVFLEKNSNDFLEGLKSADKSGRRRAYHNPGILMALELFQNKLIHEKRQLVVLPYKDKLELFPKYLQQLIMESLGKTGEGITVYGNKGSSDQHSYIQQLMEGPDNFTVNFINVRKYPQISQPLPNGNHTGDYLFAFQLGTSNALAEEGRKSITISLPELNEFYLGFLIGLYERITGFYASFAGINAYNQPAVEKGKAASERMMLYKNKVIEFLKSEPEKEFTSDEIAGILKIKKEDAFAIFEHLSSSGLYPVERIKEEEDCSYLSVKYKYLPQTL
jgi:glucose-6-phosphate isomerase